MIDDQGHSNNSRLRLAAEAIQDQMILRLRSCTSAQRRTRSHRLAHRRICCNRKRHLMNCLIANCSLEAARAPTNTLVTPDDKESDTRCKGSATVYEYFEYPCLRLLLVDLGNGRLNDGHVARSFRARRFRGSLVDSFFLGRSQVLQN